MSANEGPSKSDFKKSRELPECGAHCEHIHGDQVSPDDVVHDALKAEIAALKAALVKRHHELTDAWADVDDLKAFAARTDAKAETLKAEIATLEAQRDRAELHQKTATEAAHALLERAEKAEAEVAALNEALENEKHLFDVMVQAAAALGARQAAERLAQVRLEVIHNDSRVIATIQAERDGAIAEASAAKRERDVLRSDRADLDRYVGQLEARLHSEDPRRVTVFRNSDHHVRAEAIEEEREAILEIVKAQPFYPDTITGTRQQWVKDQIATAIRARSGQ